MDYRQAVAYMEECASYGSVLGLEVMGKLLAGLGDPQKELRFIHVAGTNGKGSVCSFIRKALSSAGYVTGAYSSPAVFKPLEIISVNGRNISGASYARLLEEISAVADAMDPHPTVFEMETALAFMYFRSCGCDIVVLECGLGGRGDATNIIPPPLECVITSVSADHTHILGRTLGEIAANKADIIKKGSVAVTLIQDDEVMDAIRERASLMEAPLYAPDPELCISIKETSLSGTVFEIDMQKLPAVLRDLIGRLMDDKDGRLQLRISLPGAHQSENALLALTALSVLAGAGFDRIDKKAVRKGFGSVRNPGRFEVISQSPLTVIDGAHNPDAALRLRENLDLYFKGRRLIFVIGVFRDKDYDTLLRYTCDRADQVITVSAPGSQRALPALELARAASAYSSSVTAAASVEEAAELARLMAGKKDVIVAFGSLAWLGRFAACIGKDLQPPPRR